MKKRTVLSGLAGVIISFSGCCTNTMRKQETYSQHSKYEEGVVWINYDSLTKTPEETKFQKFCENYRR